MDCLFCKIASGEIPVEKLYDDEYVTAFKDINPVAPVHILVIPKVHISSVLELDNVNFDTLGRIFKVINKLSEEFNIAKDGFRVVTNCGDNGGQSVKHLHFHLIGGRNMQWPPG
jgi:histidine triad (HIT) family protein